MMEIVSFAAIYKDETHALELHELDGLQFDVVVSENSCMVLCLGNHETEVINTSDPAAAVGEYLDHLWGVCADVYVPAADGDGWETSGEAILPSEGIKLVKVLRWNR